MTERSPVSTETVCADSLNRSSAGWFGEEDLAINAIPAMREIPEQELRSLLYGQEPDSALIEDRDRFIVRTKTMSVEGQLPTFRPRRYEKPSDRFIPLQKWEGVVLEVEPDIFRARLVDLTCPNPPEEVELPRGEVSDSDVDLLRPGGLFYWTIGYLDDRFGQRQRTSRIRFRRLPPWTADELESARREAELLAECIGWK